MEPEKLPRVSCPATQRLGPWPVATPIRDGHSHTGSSAVHTCNNQVYVPYFLATLIHLSRTQCNLTLTHT